MSVSAPQSLFDFVDHPRVECLNQAVGHTITAAFKNVQRKEIQLLRMESLLGSSWR